MSVYYLAILSVYIMGGLLTGIWVLFDYKKFFSFDDKPIYGAVCLFLLTFVLWPLVIFGIIFLTIDKFGDD